MKKLFSFVAAVLCAVSMSAAVDVLTAEVLGATGGGYADFSGKKATSDAVYAGNCMKNSTNDIQLRYDSKKNKLSGIVTTTSGGKLTAVRISWGTWSDSMQDRTLEIYGSNTAYTDYTDLFDTEKQGTLLGSFNTMKGANSFTVEGDYTYIGIRSQGGALYLKNITIAWDGSELPGEEEPEPEPEPVVVDTLTCAAAAKAALAGSSDSAVVIGYVTEIASPWTADKGYTSFWMADSVNGGQVFEAYHAVCKAAEDAPGVGDKVAVKGKLGKYNTTPEMLAGCTFTILERSTVEPEEKGKVTIAEFLEAKDKFNIYTLCGTVSDIQKDKQDSTQYSVYGNFNLTDSTGTIYIYGLLTAEGEAKKFLELGIEEGDVITLKGSYTEFKGTPQIKDAIFVSKSSGEMALEAVRSEEKAEKCVVNGQLVIIRNGVMYNAAGTRID